MFLFLLLDLRKLNVSLLDIMYLAMDFLCCIYQACEHFLPKGIII